MSLHVAGMACAKELKRAMMPIPRTATDVRAPAPSKWATRATAHPATAISLSRLFQPVLTVLRHHRPAVPHRGTARILPAPSSSSTDVSTVPHPTTLMDALPIAERLCAHRQRQVPAVQRFPAVRQPPSVRCPPVLPHLRAVITAIRPAINAAVPPAAASCSVRPRNPVVLGPRLHSLDTP